MKTVVTIKMFLVLCCSTNTNNNSGYSYEVQELNDKVNNLEEQLKIK